MKRLDDLLTLIKERFAEKCRLCSLSAMTTWQTGGDAVVIFADSTEVLASSVELTLKEGYDRYVLGMGSNVLASDDGCRELLVRLSGSLSASEWIDEGDRWRLTCGAGAHLPSISGSGCTKGAAGLEFAIGIPGTLGGAVFMNAGAYGNSMSEVLVSVSALDEKGNLKRFRSDECEFGYRTSRFQRERYIITSAEMVFDKGDSAELRREARRILDLRRRKFPLEYPNAGSVFRKPDDVTPPGKVIEEAGMKGLSVGGAMVSRKHANFIVNTGGATSGDIASLIEDVRKGVLEHSGILLKEEVRYVGWQ